MDMPLERTRQPMSLDLPQQPTDDPASRDRDGRPQAPPSLDLPNDPQDAPDDARLPDPDRLPGDPDSPDRMTAAAHAADR